MSRSPRHSRDLRQLLHAALRDARKGNCRNDLSRLHPLRRALLHRVISSRAALPGAQGNKWVSTLYLLDAVRRRNWRRGDPARAMKELLLRAHAAGDAPSCRRAQVLRRLLRRRYPAVFALLPASVAHDPRAWPYPRGWLHPVAVLSVDVILEGAVLRRGTPVTPAENGGYLVVAPTGSGVACLPIGGHLVNGQEPGHLLTAPCEKAIDKRRFRE